MPDPDANNPAALLNAVFTEVFILAQLAGALFAARLPPGFTVAQFGVLNHLVRVGDGATPRALARAFQVPKTSMTHSLAVLQRHDLITLAVNPQDARSKCVRITPSGRAFRDQAIAALAPDIQAIATAVPATTLEQALPVLATLRRLMDARRDW